jgi:hypothetical protein
MAFAQVGRHELEASNISSVDHLNASQLQFGVMAGPIVADTTLRHGNSGDIAIANEMRWNIFSFVFCDFL